MKKTTKITKKTKDGKIKIIITEIKKSKNLKALLIASIALLLCIATVLSIVLISNSKSPLEKFVSKITRKQNFQMDIVLSGIPLFGSVALTCEVDGDVMHIPQATFVSEQYIESVDNKRYTYTKDDAGKWTRTESDDGADSLLSGLQDNETFQKLMNLDNYEEVEGEKNVYRQKEGVELENFKNIQITIEKDTCTIQAILYTDGMALDTIIVISKIGEMDVTLPRVNK